MKFQSIFNKKGVTLIELLVALVIAAITLAGIYRVFISQTKTYAIQDQVVETQQNVRSAMEILLRDLRMAGFDDDRTDTSTYADGTNNPKIVRVPASPILFPVKNPSDDITVNYEYFNRNVNPGQQLRTVRYWRDAGTSKLMRQLTVDGVPELAETILENVDKLEFTYGVDNNDDDVLESWVDASGSVGKRVIAVRVVLTARPDQTNPDVKKAVSPRTLYSIVMMRNLCLR